jgi:phospholipid/cholesterol/gamma-HCH transport system ATP-binding protein
MSMKTAGDNVEIPALEFRHVSFGFDQGDVLTDINFQLKPGSIMVITGEHGSGKSVLLHLANGLLKPDEGEILIAGRHIENLEEEQLLDIRGKQISLVFQESALFTSLTVYENAAFRLEEMGWPQAKIYPAVREILRYVNLEKSMNKMWEELSVGMRRRLEIARGLIGWPTIMLFDEPTAGLDPVNTKQILNLILGARDLHNVTLLYVTKELWEINYFDRHYIVQDENGSMLAIARDEQHARETNVLVLERGKAAFYGSPIEFEHSSLAAVLNLTHPQGTMARLLRPVA